MKDYLYDGSFEGLLTAIFYSYQEKCHIKIIKSTLYTPTLLSESTFINTEIDKADRVYTSIEEKLSTSTLTHVYYLYLSELEDAETLILNYLKLCYRSCDSINLAKNNDIIRLVDQYVRRVHHEHHRFLGFVRFKEISPLVFYATIETDHNILPLLMNHFKERFSDQQFIIHDHKRNQAIVSNQKECILQKLTAKESSSLLQCNIEDPCEALFKSYYQSITIEERLNPKRRNGFMPKRYFKNLVEI